MEFDLDDLVRRKRLTTADHHLLAGRAWRLLGDPELLHSPLAYGAFELRCAIERCLFEFLWLTQNRKLTKKDFTVASNLSNLVKELLKRHGGVDTLRRKMSFARAFSEAQRVPMSDRPAVFEVKKLEKLWGRLSEYCHRQLEPKKTWESMGEAWIKKGYTFLHETEDYLWQIMVDSKLGWMDHTSLPPEMVDARDAYMCEQINDSGLKMRMDLMTPVLMMRAAETLILSS